MVDKSVLNTGRWSRQVRPTYIHQFYYYYCEKGVGNIPSYRVPSAATVLANLLALLQMLITVSFAEWKNVRFFLIHALSSC